MTSLLDVVSALDAVPAWGRFGPSPTIYARRPWTPGSDAQVATRRPADPAFEYLLEVNLAREAVEVWRDWRDGAVPTPEEATLAVIHYAEFDAYQPVD